MAVSAVAGLMGALGFAGAAALGLTSVGLTLGTFAASFAVGAGLSIVSRALMPKPELGASLTGLTSTVREPASTRKIIYGRSRVGGAIVFIHNSGEKNKNIHFVIAYAAHVIDAYEEIYLNDKLVWTAGGGIEMGWADYVRIDFYDGTQTTADANLVAESVKWTSDHKLLDNAYIHIRLTFDADKFPQGVPNVSAIIRGKKVYDPRQDSTSSYYDSGVGVDTQRVADASTWEWSQNPAICVLDYLTNSKYGLGEPHSNIDYDYIVAAADSCDTEITITDGTQTKFNLNGIVDTGETIKGNIEAMLASMGGRLVFSGGKYYLTAAEYQTPVDYVIDETDLVGQLQVNTKQSRRNLYNGVKGVFLSEEKNYILADYPAQLSSSYATIDGDPIYLDMSLPFVTNNIRAQRIAKIALLKSRQQTQISIPLNLAGLKYKAGDFIKVSNTRLGWTEKVFEVLDYSLQQTADGAYIVNLSAVETDSTVYDWTLSDEQVFLEGGELDLDDGRFVNPPVLTTSASRALQQDGTVASVIDATWTEPDSLVDYYVVTVTPAGGTPESINTQGNKLRYVVTDTTVEHTVTVKAVNYVGVSSATQTSAESPIVDTTAPALPSSVTATGGLNQITVKWTNPSDSDFKHVEVFENAVNTAPTAGSTPLAKIDSEEFVKTGLGGIQTRYYWVRSVDTSGNKSDWVAAGSGTTTILASADHSITGLYRITTDDSAAPSGAEFNAASGRDPKDGDLVITTDSTATPVVTYAWEYNGTSWDSVPNLISGDLLVDGSITASKLTVDELSSITADLGSITAGSIELGTTPPTAGSAPTTGESGAALANDGKITLGNDTNYVAFDGSTVTVRGSLNADDITAGELEVERLAVKNFNNLVSNNRFNGSTDWSTVTTTTDSTFGTTAIFTADATVTQSATRLLPEVPAKLAGVFYIRTDGSGITTGSFPDATLIAQTYAGASYQGDVILATFDLTNVTSAWQRATANKPAVFGSTITHVKIKLDIDALTSGNLYITNLHVSNELRGEGLAVDSVDADKLNIDELADISTALGQISTGTALQLRFRPANSAPASPLTGTVYFDNTTSKLKCWDGSAWNDLF